MAFNFTARLKPMEFRALRSDSGKNGPWMSLVFEDPDSNQVECSVKQDMQGRIYSLGLAKGDICEIHIRAVARADGNSYIQLLDEPAMLLD